MTNLRRSLVTLKKYFLFIIFFTLISVSYVFSEPFSLNINIHPLPPNLTSSVKFIEPSGNDLLDAGESGKLVIIVTNNGKGDAFDVKCEIRTNKDIQGLSYNKNVDFGTITAGAISTKEVFIRASEEINSEKVSFEIFAKDANGFESDPMRIAFSTKSFVPPKLAIVDVGINDATGVAKIEPGKIVELIARVQNLGQGDAMTVSVDVIAGSNVFLAMQSNSHFDLGVMKSGDYKDIKFSFYTNNQIKNGQKIPITLAVNEKHIKYNLSQTLNLVMNAPQRQINEYVVKGKEQKKEEIQIASGLNIDTDINIPEGETAGRYDIAVIIGNKNYAVRGVPEVAYADRDARIMKEYLIKTFGFAVENIIYEEDATLSKFFEIFGSERSHKGQLASLVKKNESAVFIYYVGHGAPDLDSQEAYFVPVDANPQFISTSGYRLQNFYDNISKIQAKKIMIVLDSCFSGNSDKGLLFKNISPTMVKVKKGYKGPSNAVVITSAAEDQVSSWYPAKKHSLFTYYFLKGIQGEADFSKDGKITIGELKTYLNENVPYWARRESRVEQQPVVIGNDSDVIVKLRK
jgi:hypothetical protein